MATRKQAIPPKAEGNFPAPTTASPDLSKEKIVVESNPITIVQLFRGNQDVQTWYNNLKLAEQLLAPQRRWLYQTYVDVSIDPYLSAMIDKRVRAVKTVPFEWQNLGNDVIKENFAAPWFQELIGHIMKNRFWGTTLIEIEKSLEDGLICDTDIVPYQNIKPEFGTISVDGSSTVGYPYRDGIYKNYILEVGHKRDLGMLAKLAPYVLLKRANLADFSRYNEMFGHDLRIFYYDPSKPDAKKTVERQAKEYGTAAYIVLPLNYGNVQFQASNKQSSAAMYDGYHNLLNTEICISILGQTLTTAVSKGGGSRALGDVHKDVEEAINMEDRLMVEYVLNYPFRKNILIPHGYPLQDIKGGFKISEELPIDKKIEAWLKLIDANFPIAEEDLYNEFGIPMPDGRPVFVKPVAPNPFDAPPDPNAPPAPEPPKPQPGGAGKKKQAAKLSQQLSAFYASQCPVCSGTNLSVRGIITLAYKDDLSSVIDDLIDKLYKGLVPTGSVDKDLYELLGSRLFDAVEAGYGAELGAENVTATVQDKLLVLRDNVYRFSAFKTYHFVQEANDLLKNADGTVKDFAQFKKDILNLNKEYNINLLRTEYNHAKAVSRMAQKWTQIKAESAALPLLQYVTVGDARVRKAHQALDGITRKVEDDFWKKYYPPLDWNCRCTVKQVTDGETVNVASSSLPQLKPGFGHNWGEVNYVFPPDHPQFSVSPGDQSAAENNFGVTLP